MVTGSRLIRSYLWMALLLLAFGALSACSGGDGGETGEACSSRSDCPEGQRCNEAGVCSSQQLSCQSINDCAPDEFCNADGVCDSRACADDTDCGDGAFCLERDGGEPACVLGACRTSDDCTGGKVCSDTNICTTEGCTTGDCGSFQRCDDSQSPPACAFTQDCGGPNADAICVAWARQEGAPEDDYYCESATQKCTPRPPCGADSDCASDEICEARATDGKLVCTDGCRDNDQCRSGEICDTTPGVFACVPGCNNDSDCERNDGNTYACSDLVCVETCSTRNDCEVAGQICSGNPRVCRGCTEDNQCPATEECEIADGMTQGLCVALPPECPDDGLGDNHAPERAHEITSFPFERSEAGGNALKFCQSNAGGDWFEFTATGGELIEVTLTYDAREGNLDIGLIRPDGTQIVASEQPPTTDGGNELIRYGVELGATFLVQVRGTTPSTNIDYELTVDVGAPPACTTDVLEPNSNTDPAPLAADVDHVDLRTCGDAADYYLLDVALNQIVTVRAEAPVNLGDIDVILRTWDASTSTAGSIVAQAQTNRDVETLLYSTDTGGEFFLEVRVASGVGNVRYDLEWSQQANDCADTFEPNDTCASAAPLAPGLQSGLNVCPDGDFYELELLPLQTVTVTATYPLNAAGDLDLNLYGPNDCAVLAATEIETVDANGITSTLTYQAQQGGVFVLATTLFQGLRVAYDLDLDIADGPACVNDGFNNNDPSGAKTIDRDLAGQSQDNVLTGAKLCDSETDYYAVDLQEGDDLQWIVSFDHDLGDIDAAIVTVDGQGAETVVASATSTTDDETVSVVVAPAEAGTYYLKVFGKYALRNDYWVLTYLNGGAPVDPACPDVYENNDARPEARAVDPGAYSLLVCTSDSDWFSTPVEAGETLSIDLGFLHATGNVNLALFDDSGSTASVVRSQGLGDTERVSYTSARDQIMVWQVHTVSSGALVPYDMNVVVTPAPPCTGDRFDPNATAGAAASVDLPALYDRLIKCEAGADWFAVELEAGEAFEAFLNFDGSRGDLDAYLYAAADPSTPLASATSSTSDESLVYTPSASGTYLVEVTSALRTRLGYDLMLYVDGVGPQDRICPDPYENNDSTNTAARIPIGRYDDLLLCWGGSGTSIDRDFYEVFVPGGASLTVDLFFTHADGDVQLRVLKGNTTVGQSLTGGDGESVTVTNTGAGTYYKVEVFGGAGSYTNRYSMELSLAFADTCAEDAFGGPNQAGAITTSTGAYADLILCEGTEDWFELPAGTTSVEAHLELSNKLGNLDLELWTSTGLLVASATSANVESIVEAGLSAGQTHFLRVRPQGGTFLRNAYDLWLSVDGATPTLPFCPDAYERNDEQISAEALVGSSLFTELIACGQDRDWYSLPPNLSAAYTYAVNVFFDHGAGADLTVAIYDGSGTAIDVTEAGASTTTKLVDSANDDELLTFKPPINGTYYLAIENKLDGQAPYDLYFQQANLPGCQDDSFEPNDNLPTARPISLPFDQGLVACSTDDYFKFTADSADPITITLAFDGADMDLSMQLTNLTQQGQLAPFIDDSVGNRETYTFTPTTGNTYALAVQRGFDPNDTSVQTTGPYFLHITR